MTTPGNAPPPPNRELPTEWEHSVLYKSVREAIATLPVYFRTETHISGIMATDLHTLNTVLGATIEEQVVRTLNLIRTNGTYALYSFVRQPQTFPDVLLRKASGDDTIMGIELKGWYLLAKEGEPSLRYQVTVAACTKQDLLVVVPWVLGNVISGSPILFESFIESAKYAAEFRNYHWQHIRKSTQDSSIDSPAEVKPYPSKADQILDKPRFDGGGNFGRLARTGMMNDYMAKLNEISLCGIRTAYWREFLRAFQESTTDAQARLALERLRLRIQSSTELPNLKAQAALSILVELEKILDLNA